MATPQKILCKVESIVDHGGHVYTVGLLPETPLPRFKAGQFLHLALDPYDPSEYWPESRVFSISSSPSEREKLLITYSVKGVYTTRMEKELVLGREIWVKLPYGEFIIDPALPCVLIAGGTGMTAFAAFIDNLSAESTTPVTIIYGARTRSLLIFRAFLEEKRRKIQNLNVWYFIEDAVDLSKDEVKGQISVESLLQKVEFPKNADFYISGPPGMLKTITAGLIAHEITAEKIHTDAWE